MIGYLLRWRQKRAEERAEALAEAIALNAACEKADFWEDYMDTWGCGRHSQDLTYEEVNAKFERERALHGTNMVY